jgi:hypothetical protein
LIIAKSYIKGNSAAATDELQQRCEPMAAVLGAALH